MTRFFLDYLQAYFRQKIGYHDFQNRFDWGNQQKTPLFKEKNEQGIYRLRY